MVLGTDKCRRPLTVYFDVHFSARCHGISSSFRSSRGIEVPIGLDEFVAREENCTPATDVPFFLLPLSPRIHSQVNLGFRRERLPPTRNLIVYFSFQRSKQRSTDTYQESIFIRHRLLTGSVRCAKVTLIPSQCDALTVCRMSTKI